MPFLKKTGCKKEAIKKLIKKIKGEKMKKNKFIVFVLRSSWGLRRWQDAATTTTNPNHLTIEAVNALDMGWSGCMP